MTKGREELDTWLEWIKQSDRTAVHLLAATFHSLGHDVSDMTLSRSTVQLVRAEIRKKTAHEVK